MKVLVPPVKSQGIKTKLVPWIASILPESFSGRWIEPFLGTGVVAFNVAPARALLSDANPHLIDFYQGLSEDVITPALVKEHLETEGQKLRDQGESHYYYIRDRFNDTGSPLDFLFVNRAGFNGMIRFNRKGKFNIPFCRKPNRFAQAYVTKIVNQTAWVHRTIKAREFVFRCQDFGVALSEAVQGDIIYCDPPYIDRHVDYYSGWNDEDERKLERCLRDNPAKFILSTWHHNDYRQNIYIDELWSLYAVLTRQHFYHVGAKEQNRNPMTEALVTSLQTNQKARALEPFKQLSFGLM